MAFPNRTTIVEQPDGSLVSLAEVKDHLSLFGDTTFDTYLNRLMIVATDHVGVTISEALAERDVEDYYARFSRRLYLSTKASDSAVVLTYVDREGTTETVVATDYTLDTSTDIQSVYFRDGFSLPGSLSRAVQLPIKIAYTELDSTLEEQESIKQSILLMIGDMFKDRENQVEGSRANVNITMDRLLRPHRSNLI